MEEEIVKKKLKRNVGDLVKIDIRDGSFGFGRVLAEPLMVFYDLKTKNIPDLLQIASSSTLFTLWVMNHAVTTGKLLKIKITKNE